MDLENAIETYATNEAKEEIEYRLALQKEDIEYGESNDPPNLYLAYSDTYEWAQEHGLRAMLTSLRRVAIATGVYREVTDDELARTTVMGGKAYEFKLDGTKYEFDRHPS